MAWVQLLRVMQIEKAGTTRSYNPGDWVDVGRQTAQRWVLDGVARFATPQPIHASLDACGIVVSGDRAPVTHLNQRLPLIPIEFSEQPALGYARTMIWDTKFKLRAELVPLGFDLLERWEVAAPLVSYDELAVHVGTPDARQRTISTIHDLRVPLYDPRLMFIRRCRAGEALIAVYEQERETGDDPRLCLLRALYLVKPLVCALPVTWRRDAPAIA